MRLIRDFLFPWQQYEILYQFVLREIHARYRQSFLGLLWLMLTPLLTLAVYTLVFRFIFQSRWDMDDAGTMAFAFRLFVGLSIFTFFSECLMRAPRLIVDQPNLVKKVVFPLPLLVWTQAISALVQLLLALLLLFFGLWIEAGTVPWGIFGAPLIIIPVFYLVLGITWTLASLGVYLRDLQQVIGLTLSLMLFLTPIFYPLSALPLAWQEWMQWNLLAYWIETLRLVIFNASLPDPIDYLMMCSLSIAIAALGALTFHKVQEGFADVL